MDKGTPIQIHQVGNGWIVQPAPDWQNPHCTPTTDTLVFNRMGNETALNNTSTLLGFVNNHFDCPNADRSKG